MTAPVFGDKETIRKLDPYRVLLDYGVAVPPHVLLCRFCSARMQLSFDDTWIDGDEFGAGQIILTCEAEPMGDFDSYEMRAYADSHSYRYQDDAMEDELKVVKWLQSIYPTFKNEC